MFRSLIFPQKPDVFLVICFFLDIFNIFYLFLEEFTGFMVNFTIIWKHFLNFFSFLHILYIIVPKKRKTCCKSFTRVACNRYTLLIRNSTKVRQKARNVLYFNEMHFDSTKNPLIFINWVNFV